MKVIDLQNAVDADWALQHFSILPTDSIVLLNANLNNIPKLNSRYVFIDASYDPVRLSNLEIQELINIAEHQNPQSHVVFLSSRCQDFYTDNPNILWYPVFFLGSYDQPIPSNRYKRIGCLNRRNAPHRIWLMHNLLSQQLIDHDRDIFSVSFKDIITARRCRIGDWIDITREDSLAMKSYPDTIATIPDNFINDHTITHPAWHTAITIVTETEVGDMALITEKTAKAIAAQCCWMLYTGQSQLDVMKSLGFELGMFEQHATGHNIDPIIDICQTLDTKENAMDHYHSQKHLIDHNSKWFKQGWLEQYLKKLNDVLY